MQRPLLILSAAAFSVLALAAPAHAACNPADLKSPAGTARIYDGTIGGAPARIALIFGKDGSVEGRYALATSTSDNVIRGRIEPGGERMTLTERDGQGQTRLVFSIVFPDTSERVALAVVPPREGEAGSPIYRPVVPAETKPGFAYAPYNPGCGEFGGAMQESGGASKSLNFASVSRTIDHPQFGHLYAIAGVSDDEIVNRRAQEFRDAIVDNRRDDVVKHFRFPIAFTVKGKFVVIENERGMLKRYDDLFTPMTRANLARLVPRMMQAAEAGVMLTFGVWLDKDGYIITW